MGRLIDLKGKRFGSWTVLRKSKAKRRHAFWICRCDCGVQRAVSGDSLRRGVSTNCGCVRIEKIRRLNLTHGESQTPLYDVWQGICLKRAKRKSESVPVCEEWRDYFTFAEWARSHGYRQGLILSRIDISRGWFPENACFKLAKNSSHGKMPYKPIPKPDKNGRRNAP